MMDYIHCLPDGKEKLLVSAHGKYAMDLTYEVTGHGYHWEMYISPVLNIGVYKFAPLEYPGCTFYNEGTFMGTITELLREARTILDDVENNDAVILDGREVWKVLPTSASNTVMLARGGGHEEYVYCHNTSYGPLMCVHMKYDVEGKCYWKQQHVAYDVVWL